MIAPTARNGIAVAPRDESAVYMAPNGELRLEVRGRLFRDDGTPRFDSNALVALALLVAESDPKQRELVLRLVLAMLSH